MKDSLFDNWADQYNSWFTTPIGRYVKQYEEELLTEFLEPAPGEKILDVGCGTGIFTRNILKKGAVVTGMDISCPMIEVAKSELTNENFIPLCADMCSLPFAANSFDKAVSMTAIEFVEDAESAIIELNRIVIPGGTIVVTTLNSISPWAERRRKKAAQGHSLFKNIFFRSPEEMKKLISRECLIKTAIHFPKDVPLEHLEQIENAGKKQQLDTGAFLASKWFSP